MVKSLLWGAGIFFILGTGIAYGLDVTVGTIEPGADFSDFGEAFEAVHDDGGGTITILDNAEYQDNNRITDPVDIVVTGDPLNPPTLWAVEGCLNSDRSTCPGPADDPVTTVLNESHPTLALFHVQGGLKEPDPAWAGDPNANPGLPAVPLDGGSLTLNGLFFRSCGPNGQLMQCQIFQVATDDRGDVVNNYTVNFNDCIFEDREALWPNANGTDMLLWYNANDITMNFDNCIIPWNGEGIKNGCQSGFIVMMRGAASIGGANLSFNQCTIGEFSSLNTSTHTNFIHARKENTVINVTNSIVWPHQHRVGGQPYTDYARFVKSHVGQNAHFCHEHESPSHDPGSTTVVDGGSGYEVGDRLTLVGGDQTLLQPNGNPDTVNWPNPEPAVFTVVAVEEGTGAVTAANRAFGPHVYAMGGRPPDPTTTTGGSGSGATLSVGWDDDVFGTLLTGTVSNSVAKFDDPDGEYDWFREDKHGFLAIGANVVSEDPLLVNGEGTAGSINRDPLDLMDGYELEVGSPAIGRGDMGQDAGWTRPLPPPTGACQLPGGDCEVLTAASCATQGGTYDGDGATCGANLPGDCNQDGTLDLSDVICLLGHLFQGNPATLPCATDAANLGLMDCNMDGGVDLSDAIYKLAFLFQGGAGPVQGQDCLSIADCPPNASCP